MHNKHFKIIPSHFLRNWIIAIHLLVWFILIILPVAFWIKLILNILIILCFLYYSNQDNSIESFRHHQDSQWFLFDRQGKQYAASLLPQNFISDFLVIVYFSDKQRLILFRHQFIKEDWCCLQRLLRC